MSSGVNMLTNGLKISDTTETEPFKLILFQSDEKMCQKTTVQIEGIFRTV